MLWDSDLYVGKLVDQLKQKGMYENTLIIYSADNGGTGEGINWPLRGTKHTNWCVRTLYAHAVPTLPVSPYTPFPSPFPPPLPSFLCLFFDLAPSGRTIACV